MRKLYKRDETGARRIWWAEVDGSRYRLHSGQLDGKIVTSDWTKCEGKNVGRSNATNANQQAVVEVEALYKKKCKKGYTDKLSEIDKAREVLIKPMLAHKWEDHLHKIRWNEPVYSQPKLDGIRCIVRPDGAWTRKGEPILSVPHITDKLIRIATRYDMLFDGELYNHELREDFNKITSLVRRQKVSLDHSKEVEDLVQYHIYDTIDFDKTFKERIKAVRNTIREYYDEEDPVKAVPTKICGNQVTLDAIYGDYLEQGYEGQMVRLNTIYESKRTSALLKRKEFVDEEFEIVGVLEGRGNRSGMVGAVVLALPNGDQFSAATMGTDEYRIDLFNDPKRLIGKLATVKYFHKTPGGIPRFPVVKCIDWSK